MSPEKPPSSKVTSIAFAALFLCNAAQAQSETPQASMFSFSGYGTLGVAHSSEDKADFIANDLQARGAGADRSWSPDVDSRVGAQVTAKFTPDITATLQVTAQQRADGNYAPEVEWANIKYQVTPDFSVRAGRVVLPSFMASDYRLVGYAQPWVRPPVELYSLIPLTNNDGIDLSYRLNWGDVNHTLHAAFGNSKADIPDGGQAISENGWHISDTVEYGAATLHVAYSQTKLTLEPYRKLFDKYRAIAQGASGVASGLPSGHPLAQALTQGAAQATAIADKYNADDKKLSFIGIGGSYDPGDWFVMAEWGRTKSDSVFGTRSAWYATGGYRWGKFTPYVTYAEAKLKSNNSDPGMTTSLPGPLGGFAAQANAALNAELSAAAVQKTISIGTRWDFAKNAALKLQYDHTRIGNGSPGTLDHLQPGFVPGGKFSVFSAVIDFVF